MKFLPFIFLAFVLSSCVTTTQYVKFAGSQEVSPDSARVVIIRKSPLATAVKANVFQDDKLVGKTGPRGYLSWTASADGQPVEIISKTENRERITVPFLPGETYYVRQRLSLGWLIGRFKLRLVSKEEGEDLISRLKKPVVQIVDLEEPGLETSLNE